MTQADAGQVAPTAPPVAAPRRRRKRWPPTLAFALGAGFAVWGLSIGMGQISDNSFFTHLATGRLIAGGSAIPRHDAQHAGGVGPLSNWSTAPIWLCRTAAANESRRSAPMRCQRRMAVPNASHDTFQAPNIAGVGA